MGLNIILEQKAKEWHNAVQIIQQKIEEYSEEADSFDELCIAMMQYAIKPNLWREEHFKRLSDLANQIASKDSDLATSLNTFVGISQKYYSDVSAWIPFQTTLKEHGWLSEFEEKYQEELAWEAEQTRKILEQDRRKKAEEEQKKHREEEYQRKKQEYEERRRQKEEKQKEREGKESLSSIILTSIFLFCCLYTIYDILFG